MNSDNTTLKLTSLQLLSTYESSSDEDEKTGKATLSNNSVLENSPAKRQKQERLPLPSFVANTDKITKYNDDPTLHGGRIRSFAHERGNWATYIYLPFPENEYMTNLVREVANLCLPAARLEVVNDFHISLTKTVILKYHWIESFVKTVRQKIECNSFKKFQVFFNNIGVYTNEDKTRTFLGLNIYAGYDFLNHAVEIFNECLKEFKLSSFYKDPSFHLSILWCVGNKENELNSILPEINTFVSNFMESSSEIDWSIDAKYFVCKTGNKQFVFDLT